MWCYWEYRCCWPFGIWLYEMSVLAIGLFKDRIWGRMFACWLVCLSLWKWSWSNYRRCLPTTYQRLFPRRTYGLTRSLLKTTQLTLLSIVISCTRTLPGWWFIMSCSRLLHALSLSLHSFASQLSFTQVQVQQNNDMFHQNRFIGHKLSSKKKSLHTFHMWTLISMHSTRQFPMNDCKKPSSFPCCFLSHII